MPDRLIGAVAVVLSGVGFAAGWHYGLWLVVTAMASTAIVLVACELLGERALARRAATWALYAPRGVTDGAALETAIAAELAAVAVGDTAVLDAGADRTDRIGDPWLRSLATERLELAKQLVEAGCLPPPLAVLEVLASGAVRVLSGTACATFTLAAATTRNGLWIGGLVVAVAVFGVGHGEARRRAELSAVIRRTAMAPPVRGRMLMPEPGVLASLASLTCSRPSVVTHARRLVSAASGPERDVALERLAAVASRPEPPRPRMLSRAVGAWAAIAVAGVSIWEVL